MGGAIVQSLARGLRGTEGESETKVLVLGLDAAGKTTMLHSLRPLDVHTATPTIGFHVESVRHGRLSLTSWDVGGRDKIRALWRHYYSGSRGLVFVVDSGDRERVEDCREQLHSTLGEELLAGAPLLVLANKQDLPGCMDAAEVADRLELWSLEGRRWHVHGCVASAGTGLGEGLDWLARAAAGASATGARSKELHLDPPMKPLARLQQLASALL